MNRISTSLGIGFGTLFISYFVLVGIALLSFSYFNGPVPDLFYAIPIPVLLGLTAGMIAFMVKGSR